MGYSSNKTSPTTSNINNTLEQFRNASGIGILSPARFEIMIASPNPIVEGRNISGLRNCNVSW